MGVVILTTNRLDDFDPAFHSRIHVTIPYSGLTNSDREAIWGNAISSVTKNHQTLSRTDLEKLGRLDLDGRTIKNVVNVAVLFNKSRTEDEGITLADLKGVLPIAAGCAKGMLKAQLEEFCKEG